MQSRNGGWGAFDTDNDCRLPEPHPLRRHGGDDRPADRGPDRPAARADGQLRASTSATGARAAARAFLRRTQRADGSWWGRWGGNFIYGTWSALAGLRAIGERPRRADVRRAVAWLEGAPERRRRLGRDARVLRRRDPRRPRRVDAVADGVGAARPARRRRTARRSRRRAASSTSSTRSGPTAAGTRTSSPARDSRATSTCATRSTGTTSRSWRSASAARDWRSER